MSVWKKKALEALVFLSPNLYGNNKKRPPNRAAFLVFKPI